MSEQEVNLLYDEKFRNLEDKVEVLEKKMDNVDATNNKANEAIVKISVMLENIVEDTKKRDARDEKRDARDEKQTEVLTMLTNKVTNIEDQVGTLKTEIEKSKEENNKNKFSKTQIMWIVFTALLTGLGGYFISQIPNLFK